MKWFFLSVVAIFFTIQAVFASYESYINEEEKFIYKSYLVPIVTEKLAQHSLREQNQIISRVENYLEGYGTRGVSEQETIRYVTFLKAVHEIIADSLGENRDRTIRDPETEVFSADTTTVEVAGERSVEETIAEQQELIDREKEKIQAQSNAPKTEHLQVRIISDTRCVTCDTDNIVTQLSSFDAMSGAEYIYEDFSDAGVSEYLLQNGVKNLPAYVFNKKDLGSNAASVTEFLNPLSDGNYLLYVDSTFDPFANRSDRGFLTLETQKLTEIRSSSYIKNKESVLTWIEYSDLECPFCARLHNSDVTSRINTDFPGQVSYVFQHFPLDFHDSAQEASEILECAVAESGGSDKFYSIIDKLYKDYNGTDLTIGGVYDVLVTEGYTLNSIQQCVTDGTYASKIQEQVQRGQNYFDITGTPSSIIINNVTGEYEILSGAYPYEYFQRTIQKLK